MSALSAADEFGFGNVIPINQGGSNEPATTIQSVEKSASGATYTHPTVAIAAIVVTTAYLLERTTRPAASARASGNLGPAKGSIEGEI